MTNICAAVGVAQMERIESILARKREISLLYKSLLRKSDVVFQQNQDGLISSDWLVSLLLPENIERDKLMKSMAEKGVDTRPVFYCAHQMPMYDKHESFPISEGISKRGISLPSYPSLTDNDIYRVVETLLSCMSQSDFIVGSVNELVE